MDSILAIDLGKSRCRVALLPGGAAEGAGAPGLTTPNGVALAEAAILAVARPLLAGAIPLAVGVGAAGALTAPDAAQELAERLCRSLPAPQVAVTSDAITSHLGALAGGPGVVLAVGTGAVAVTVDARGELWVVDGVGPFVGDEGGGLSIGLAGLRAVARAADGRDPATTLTAAPKTQGDLAARAAAFAPEVLRCAHEGDSAAAEILRLALAALAETVRSAAGGAITRFAMVGGLSGPLRPLLLPLLAGIVRPFAAAGTALDGARRLALDYKTLHEPRVVRVHLDAQNQLDALATEAARPGLDDLDTRSPADIVHLALAAERGAQDALTYAAPALAAVAEAVAARMRNGGRLFYLGAGTPGRLAALDAAELAPTYGAPPGLVVPLLAGGPAAMLEAVEGAEDDAAAAAAALDAYGLVANDCVVGISASGRTPYVLGGLLHARAVGALSVAVVNNAGSDCAAAADLAVEIPTGPEIVAGSTRMMAGTTQKVALNALSTAVMVSLGKTYGAHMVDVAATNVKLRRRALRIVQTVTGAPEAEAEAALAESGGQVKAALVALLAGVDAAEAARRLARAGGRVRDAIA